MRAGKPLRRVGGAWKEDPYNLPAVTPLSVDKLLSLNAAIGEQARTDPAYDFPRNPFNGELSSSNEEDRSVHEICVIAAFELLEQRRRGLTVYFEAANDNAMFSSLPQPGVKVSRQRHSFQEIEIEYTATDEDMNLQLGHGRFCSFLGHLAHCECE